MTLEFSFISAPAAEADVDIVVVPVFESGALVPAAASIDAASGGALRKLLDAGDASGKLGQVARLFALPGVRAPRVLLIGMGEPEKLDAMRFLRAATEAGKALRAGPAKRAASWIATVAVPGRDAHWRLRHAALAAEAAAYRYTTTLKAKNGNGGVTSVAFAGDAPEAALREASAIGAGMAFARELGNLPPNICTPAYVAEQARAIARDTGSSIEVLEREQMQALGMGSLLGVAQGSANAPRLVVLRHAGGGDRKPFVLVGKGITFDSGGISIKPGAGMEEMKFDMMGGATVLGAFLAVASLKLPINVVAIVPAVENMPDGNAYRPSDIVRTMSGQTVEVINTDAEGRLILCDALTYAERFQPAAIVDVATLTGACVIALGKHAHGLMTRDDELAAELLAAGDATGDRAWRLPLWDEYQQQLESAFADIANVGGKSAGAITAGCFLARFTEGMRWAHLDVAGTAWDEGRKGMATGRPVPLLVQWLLGRAAA
ncbi:MAG TPA: leucyl aminopeptidase [Xanthomonadales bacterium]|nr:leucyl aminopeptidase [Xanthomonadales bacterium]